MGIAIVLFIVEASIPGFFVGVLATVVLILGVVAYNTPPDAFDVFWRFGPIAAAVGGSVALAATFAIYRRLAPPSEPPVTRSSANLVGTECVVTRTIEPGTGKGKVRIGRENWSATTDGEPIPEGRKVRVSRVDGVILNVTEMEA